MTDEDLCSKLAEYEVGWWKGHHRKDRRTLLENMSRLYELLYGMSYVDAVKCAEPRIKAGGEHDIAEDFEDTGNQKEADIHWEKAEDLVKKHFEILLNKRK